MHEPPQASTPTTAPIHIPKIQRAVFHCFGGRKSRRYPIRVKIHRRDRNTSITPIGWNRPVEMRDFSTV